MRAAMHGHRIRSACALVLAVAAALACFGGASAGAATKPTWLCLPGAAKDPCTTSLTTTRVSPSGATLGRADAKRARNPKLDCFYVYPTVSDQPTPLANLRVDPEERSIALYQAARFSQLCRVFAPMYHQITLAGLLKPKQITPSMRTQGYRDVRTAWRYYLAHYNRGRGVVLLGHSQGSFVLRKLVAKDIDPKPAERRRIVSALLLGGNVTVKRGSDVGGDFKHVRACRSRAQVGCVVAFSTFLDPPPANSIFGRTTAPGLEVLCTNPAALGGGSAKLDSIYPTKPFAPATVLGLLIAQIGFPVPSVNTAWIEARGAYSGRCSSEGGANVLQVAPEPGAPALLSLPDASWGLHLADVDIALGDLVGLVRTQGSRYTGH